MLIPVVRRIIENKSCLIERVFPVEGHWRVGVGDFVEPFTRLGDCRFSQNEIKYPKEFKPNNFKNDKKFYYANSLLGKVKREKIFTPFDGDLIETSSGEYIFRENEKEYPLLSGVWGNVKNVYEKKSALIQTQTKDVLFAYSVGKHISGELVVFPNPSDVLKKSYLENFVKGVKGKIIYIGHHVGLDVVERAYEMGASAIISGSCHSNVFDFAKKHKFSLGIFSGFGKIKTPEEIYKFLSSVSYRYVFFESEKNILRVPVKFEDLSGVTTIATSTGDSSTQVLDLVKEIEPNMKVQVLQEPYFGWAGTVDRVNESSIFVKFGLEDKSVEIRLPNFLIVE